MANVMILYRLKAGVSKDAFDAWVRDYDYPKIRGIARIAAFTNHRVARLLIGEGAPSIDYVELFDIPDLAGFTAEDLAGPVIAEVMPEFMNWVEDPQFLVVDPIA
ncbi:MAG: REDY-like protein HapK [Pseudomonadota bacterium]